MNDPEFARAFGAVEAKLQTLIDLVGGFQTSLAQAQAERLATDRRVDGAFGRLEILRRDVDALTVDMDKLHDRIEADRAATSGALSALRDWRVRTAAAGAVLAAIWLGLARVDLARLGAFLSHMGVGK